MPDQTSNSAALASASTLLVGPILSFRGLDASIPGSAHWKVAALLGFKEGVTPPILRVAGQLRANPILLHSLGKVALWRYDCSVALTSTAQRIDYGFEGEAAPCWSFTVPAAGLTPRIAYVSCNGWSSVDAMRKIAQRQNAVWDDLLFNHDPQLRPPDYKLDREQRWHEAKSYPNGAQRFHLLCMGGDQIYLDSMWFELPELANWVSLSRDEQLKFQVNAGLRSKIRNHVFGLYQQRWAAPANRRAAPVGLGASVAFAHIPTVMMWDDHDIFDGWGSYSKEMQACSMFRTLFEAAREAFWVWQLQHRLCDLPALDSSFSEPQAEPLLGPIAWRERLQQDALALPLLDQQPGFSYAHRLAGVELLVPDLRSERSRTQILGESSWTALTSRLNQVDRTLRPRHLLVLSSVPVLHPKLETTETLLDHFGGENVINSNADDLNDHWSHDRHQGERKRLIRNLMDYSQNQGIRVSFVSGDVHVAAWATVEPTHGGPTECRLHQLTSSAVVHPAPQGFLENLFIGVLERAARQPYPIDSTYVQRMLPLPDTSRCITPARNWLALELDDTDTNEKGPRLWATWRCERADAMSNHLLAIDALTPNSPNKDSAPA